MDIVLTTLAIIVDQIIICSNIMILYQHQLLVFIESMFKYSFSYLELYILLASFHTVFQNYEIIMLCTNAATVVKCNFTVRCCMFDDFMGWLFTIDVKHSFRQSKMR